MTYVPMIAFVLATLGPFTHARDTPPVAPTRLNWCAALLDSRDQAPASIVDARPAVDQARARLAALVQDADQRATLPVMTGPVTPHLRRVTANLRRSPVAAENDEGLRTSRGRLLRLSADLAAPDPNFPPLARVTVGRDAVLKVLTEVPLGARAREDQSPPPTVHPDYYVRALGDASALTALAATFAGLTEHYRPLDDNAWALFLGGTAVSIAGLFDLFLFHERHLTSAAGRRSLINRFDRDRVNVEPRDFERLRELVDAPRRAAFAHDGYSLHLPGETLRSLLARDPRPTPFRTRFLQLRRGLFTLFIDNVLFVDPAGQITLLNTLRVLPTSEVPRTVRSLRLVGDI